MANLKIAITGKMGSGKSSLTKIIEELEHGYVTSYSSIIRSTLVNLDLTPTRELMQATGDFFRSFDKLVWTKQLLKEVKGINKTIIIEGIRYPFERDALVSEGFKIIKILANDSIRRKRITKRNDIPITDQIWLQWQNHGTEIFVDQIKADYIITNNGSLNDLRQSILNVLYKLK